jgi:hypothetical protein
MNRTAVQGAWRACGLVGIRMDWNANGTDYPSKVVGPGKFWMNSNGEAIATAN